MKMNKFFMGIMGALALTACSSEEVIPDQKPNDSADKDSRFLSIAIRNFDGGTRAGGDQSGNLYEDGLEKENAVTKIRFYFFKKDGSAFPVSAQGELNYIDVESKDIKEDDSDLSDNINVEKRLKAVLVLNAHEVDFSQLKSMVAIVNYNGDKIVNQSSTLQELQGIIENYGSGAYQQPYTNGSDIPAMLMTSSVFGYKDPNQNDPKPGGCEVYINPTKLKTDDEEALADPVDIYVERVLAKVRVTSKLPDQSVVKVDGQQAIRVKLKDKDGNQYTADNGTTEIYADLLGWGIQNYTETSYLFKNIDNWENWDLWTGWNHPEWFRSYWALNPSDVKYRHSKHTDAKGILGSKLTKVENGVTTTIDYDGSFYYTQENAGDDSSNGHKTLSNYDPETQISARTQVYIRARLVDENGNMISLAEWGGQKYTENGVKDAMLGVVNNQIWIRKATGTTTETLPDGSTKEVTVYEYKTIPASMIHLVPAEDAVDSDGNPKANDQSENSKRYLSYIQLVNNPEFEEGFEGFFDANHNRLSNTQVNGILSGMPGAKVWRNGDTYYYTDLRHLNPSNDNADSNKEKGAYGVVRNHIYEVELNSIFGLGTPVLIPDSDEEEKEIITQKPSPDSYYLGARLNILSWRVVNNGVSLDW
ncbi:MAG: Mfa1 family fimbria major subunit [Muribaculaceae bacterium]|nr:Mfa1 family fimbria major subunit [Muribaculaceae bacterium]